MNEVLLDPEEQEILEAFEADEFVSVLNDERRNYLVQSAEATYKKAKGIQDLPATDEFLAHVRDTEVIRRAQNEPSAPPTAVEELANFQRMVNVKELRTRLSMTQEQFAHTFHLSLATVRDWEQARAQPDQAARALLKIIAYDPAWVQEALEQVR